MAQGNEMKLTLTDCIQEYKRTLNYFGIDRGLGQFEDLTLGRAIQKYGVEMVFQAVKGCRKEPVRKDFDPQKFLSLRRILDEQNIEWFANLGAMKEKKTDLQTLLKD